MDDTTYLQLADKAFRRIEDGLSDVDAEAVDIERAGDVLSLSFANGKKCIINTQRPTRQLWLAAQARGWHFSYDAEAGRWSDDRNGDELYATLRRVIAEQATVDVTF